VSALEESEANLRRWRRNIANHSIVSSQHPPQRFLDRISNDLNTPSAFAVLNELSSAASGAFFGGGVAPVPTSDDGQRKAAIELAACLDFLGISPEDRSPKREVDEVKIRLLVDERLRAKKAKNFAEADRIRDELAAMGVVLKDSKEGTTWEIAR
jgi:cysteinyl-tRNA synthetase